MLSSIASGNIGFPEARQMLDKKVEIYTSSIIDLGTAVGMQLLLQGNEIKQSVDDLAVQMSGLMSKFEDHTRIIQAGVQNNSSVVVQLSGITLCVVSHSRLRRSPNGINRSCLYKKQY
jgi:hypothetical protein